MKKYIVASIAPAVALACWSSPAAASSPQAAPSSNAVHQAAPATVAVTAQALAKPKKKKKAAPKPKLYPGHDAEGTALVNAVNQWRAKRKDSTDVKPLKVEPCVTALANSLLTPMIKKGKFDNAAPWKHTKKCQSWNNTIETSWAAWFIGKKIETSRIIGWLFDDNMSTYSSIGVAHKVVKGKHHVIVMMA